MAVTFQVIRLTPISQANLAELGTGEGLKSRPWLAKEISSLVCGREKPYFMPRQVEKFGQDVSSVTH